jgi:hypothetical protein
MPSAVRGEVWHILIPGLFNQRHSNPIANPLEEGTMACTSKLANKHAPDAFFSIESRLLRSARHRVRYQIAPQQQIC